MLDKIKQAVLAGEMEGITELTNQALAQGIGARDILDQALTPAMDIVGEEYE
ncbi:MAG TPA: cobalamin-binding protein, partial [Chloroflexi bacterium]|nr:cobalamin-binding protein [Chloroflexota bacterium]